MHGPCRGLIVSVGAAHYHICVSSSRYMKVRGDSEDSMTMEKVDLHGISVEVPVETPRSFMESL